MAERARRGCAVSAVAGSLTPWELAEEVEALVVAREQMDLYVSVQMEPYLSR